jgi:hypothetical protein
VPFKRTDIMTQHKAVSNNLNLPGSCSVVFRRCLGRACKLLVVGPWWVQEGGFSLILSDYL